MPHRWSGYSAALSGDKIAQQNLVKIHEIAQASGDDLDLPGSNLTWADIKDHYRWYLHEKGVAIEPDQASNTTGCKGLDPEYVEQVIASQGKLAFDEIEQIKVRYFCDGVIAPHPTQWRQAALNFF